MNLHSTYMLGWQTELLVQRILIFKSGSKVFIKLRHVVLLVFLPCPVHPAWNAGLASSLAGLSGAAWFPLKSGDRSRETIA